MGGGAMTPMSPAQPPRPVLAVSILVGVACAGASITWLAGAIGAGRRVKDPVAAGHAAMSAGMAAMLLFASNTS